nr:hypothetical protein [Tanacetum cinerariifolium]
MLTFEIKSQFMRELKKDTFSGTKNDDAHVGCGTCEGAHLDKYFPLNEEVKRVHLDKDCPLNEEVKRVEEVKCGEFERSFPNNGGNRGRYQKDEGPSGVLPCQLPPKELSPGSFTLPHTIGRLNMTFQRDHDIRNVRHPIIPIEKVCMANSTQEEESFNPLEIGNDMFSHDSSMCLEFKKYNHLYETNESNKDTFVCDDDEYIEFIGQKGKTKMVEPGTTTLRLHSSKPIRMMGNKTCKFWPTCDPNLKECNGGDSIYGIDERGVLKQWCCYRDNKRRYINGK